MASIRHTAIFQRTMENFLLGILHVAVYIDDIILMGAIKAQCMETQDMVLGYGLGYTGRDWVAAQEKEMHISRRRRCVPGTPD